MTDEVRARTNKPNWANYATFTVAVLNCMFWAAVWIWTLTRD